MKIDQLKMKKIQICASLILFTSLSPYIARASDTGHTVQSIIHLLDYISADYPSAVRKHIIQNQQEYKEMLEFSATVTGMCAELARDQHLRNPPFVDSAFRLNKMINEKCPAGSIRSISGFIKSAVIKETRYKASPASWPDIAAGQVLYAQNCSSCHGNSGAGNGPLSKSFNPRPVNFLNDSIMKKFTALRSFNTITLGISGTAMRSFREFSPNETWSVAFYVQSLRFNKANLAKPRLETLFSAAMAELNLEDVSGLTDEQLIKKLTGSVQQKKEKLAAVRLYVPKIQPDGALIVATTDLRNALSNYLQKKYQPARQYALAAYLDGIEPVEARLSAINPAFMARLEEKMLTVRSLINGRESQVKVSKEIVEALNLIEEANRLLKSNKVSFWVGFMLAASILLREGLEAFLIIAIIITIIQAAGKKKALLWLHGGWIAAIFAGIIGWFLAGLLLRISGQNRELLEGLISILAVFILTYVGFWLHKNTDIKKWKSFVENRINTMLENEKMFGLAAFSFLVVFREAIESILFLKAIELEVGTKDKVSIGLGVLTAGLIIFIIAAIWIKYARKIPIKPLFKYSSIMIAILALMIAGKAIHSLQESGLIGIHPLRIAIESELLGLYPTIETLLGQGILVTVIIGIYLWGNRPLKGKLRI
jgi:high-affinity iron transporter